MKKLIQINKSFILTETLTPVDFNTVSEVCSEYECMKHTFELRMKD